MTGVYPLIFPSDTSTHSADAAVDQLYLITAWVADQQPLFGDFLAGRLLVDVLRQQLHRADTWAYVVMPDYLHWLVKLRAGMSLHKLVEQVLTLSSQAVMRYLGLPGLLWREQYRQQRVWHTTQARTLARQLVAAPRQAGLVSAVGDYPLWDARQWL